VRHVVCPPLGMGQQLVVTDGVCVLRSELQPVRLRRHCAQSEPHDPPEDPGAGDPRAQGTEATLTPPSQCFLVPVLRHGMPAEAERACSAHQREQARS